MTSYAAYPSSSTSMYNSGTYCNYAESVEQPRLPSLVRMFDDNQHYTSQNDVAYASVDANAHHKPRSNTWPQFPLPNGQEAPVTTPPTPQFFLPKLYEPCSDAMNASYTAHNDSYAVTSYSRSTSSPEWERELQWSTQSQGYDHSYVAKSYQGRRYDPFSSQRPSGDVLFVARGRGGSPVDYHTALYERGNYMVSPSARHQCSLCGKRFSRPSGLKIHITTHTGEKPFVCPEEGCHRSFSVRSNMRRHVRVVHQSLESPGTPESEEL